MADGTLQPHTTTQQILFTLQLNRYCSHSSSTDIVHSSSTAIILTTALHILITQQAGGMDATFSKSSTTRGSSSGGHSIGPMPGKKKSTKKLKPLAARSGSKHVGMSDFPEMDDSNLPWGDSKMDSLEEEYDSY